MNLQIVLFSHLWRDPIRPFLLKVMSNFLFQWFYIVLIHHLHYEYHFINLVRFCCRIMSYTVACFFCITFIKLLKVLLQQWKQVTLIYISLRFVGSRSLPHSVNYFFAEESFRSNLAHSSLFIPFQVWLICTCFFWNIILLDESSCWKIAWH